MRNGEHDNLVRRAVQTFGAERATVRWLRRVRPEETGELGARARADGHELILPTHVFEKHAPDGTVEIVGAASVGAVPLLLPWFDTERCRAADSRYFIDVIENTVAATLPGVPLLCCPVMEGSPFEPYISKLGYVNAGKGTVTFKHLKT